MVEGITFDVCFKDDELGCEQVRFFVEGVDVVPITFSSNALAIR